MIGKKIERSSMMSLDTWGNIADIVAIPIAVLGLLFIVRQLQLALQESEKEHQRRQNEMTLNAYNAVRGDLRDSIRRVRNELQLEDMFDTFEEKHLELIITHQHLRHDVSRMLGYLNKFAVGIKYDVFNIHFINDLAGALFIETYRQFKPYIDWVRKDSSHFYIEYEKLVEELIQLRNSK